MTRSKVTLVLRTVLERPVEMRFIILINRASWSVVSVLKGSCNALQCTIRLEFCWKKIKNRKTTCTAWLLGWSSYVIIVMKNRALHPHRPPHLQAPCPHTYPYTYVALAKFWQASHDFREAQHRVDSSTMNDPRHSPTAVSHLASRTGRAAHTVPATYLPR